jgi:hypothetical protein
MCRLEFGKLIAKLGQTANFQALTISVIVLQLASRISEPMSQESRIQARSSGKSAAMR